VIVPREEVDDFLRKKIYSKDATLPFGRDSAHHLLLKETIGISRRVLMEFLRKQKNIQVSKPSLPKAKTRPGKKISKLTLEFDLVFVRRPDLVQANKKFANDGLKFETYILTTVEVASGLTKLSYLQTKDNTTTEVLKHIKWFANKYGVATSKLACRSDDGSEFVVSRIKAVCPDYKIISSGKSVERKNSQVQANFYRILKNRQARTIKSALQKAEDMCNNTVNRKFKKTANEVVEEKIDPKVLVKTHNITRAEFKPGDNRGDLNVGDHVRVLAPEKKRTGLKYKTYKEMSYENTVRKIIKTTGPRAKTRKYQLDDKRWKLIDQLMKSAPEDKKSQQLIKDRDDEEKNELEAHRKHLRDFQASIDIVKKDEEKKGRSGLTRRGAAKRMLDKLKKQRELGELQDKEIERQQKLYEKRKNRKDFLNK
jgi:hypothetical protein